MNWWLLGTGVWLVLVGMLLMFVAACRIEDE